MDAIDAYYCSSGLIIRTSSTYFTVLIVLSLLNALLWLCPVNEQDARLVRAVVPAQHYSRQHVTRAC